MPKIVKWLIVFVILFMPDAHAGESLSIGGTGGDLGSMRIMGAEFKRSYPDVSVEVLTSLGSGGGIRAVSAGVIDISISSRPPKKSEMSSVIEYFAYASTALVFATNSKASVGPLNVRNLEKIFSQEKRMWSDGSPLRLVLRPKRDGDYKLLIKAFPTLKNSISEQVRLRSNIGTTDQDAANFLEKLSGSFGLTSLSLISGEKRKLRLLPLQGVSPTTENIKNGKYPLNKTYYMVTKSPAKKVTNLFIKFLKSEAGQKVLIETGHVPLQIAK